MSVSGEIYKKSVSSNVQYLYLKSNSFSKSNVLVYDSHFTEVSHGDVITVTGTEQIFESARNPGNFDSAFYYACQNVGYALFAENIKAIAQKPYSLQEWLYQVKLSWKEKLIEQMGDKNGGVLAAMLLGEKSEMDEDIKELYQKNGIGHILAISGLHISFVGLGLYKLLKRSGMGYIWSGILSFVFLTLYVCMIGSSVSVIRAYIMLLLRIGADIAGRVYDMLTALMLAAAITVCIQPLYLMDGSFLMSYGAILGLLFILPNLKKCILRKGKFVDGLLASVSVNLMLFPVLLWFYFEFPLYSLFWNLVVIPLMSMVLGCGMLGSAMLFCCPTLGGMCLRVCKLILEGYEWIGRLGSTLPLSRVVFGKPEWWKMVCYYAILMIVLWYIHRVQKPKRWVWCVMLPVLLLMPVSEPSNFTVTMLDVGQGDGVFLRGPEGKTYLIDGGSSDVEQVGKFRIEPFLKSQGVGTLNYVFLTHGDADHCNGILEMLNRQGFGVRIETLVLPLNFVQDEMLMEVYQTACKAKVTVLVMETGQTLQEGVLEIRCLQPGKGEKLSGNEGSLVLDIRYKDFSMLCTGDVEGDGEKMLTEKLRGQSYDVLKVAHHGSRFSTSVEFLDSVNAEIALISSGVNSGYNHPHEETVRRLEACGCTIYQTAKNGAITIRTDGNSLTILLHTFRL